ncbi:MAG: hypothetical protein AABX74_01775, partial [Nanoarchaeota archaeon]
LSAQEGDYERDMFLFTSLVHLIKENPLYEKDQANEHLSAIGQRLSEREESVAYQNRLALFNGFYEATMAVRPHSQESNNTTNQSYANQAMDLGMRLLGMAESREDRDFFERMFEISAIYASDEQLMSAIDKTQFTDFAVLTTLQNKLETREQSSTELTSKYLERVIQQMEQAASEENHERRKELYKAAIDGIILTEDFRRAYEFAQEHGFSMESSRYERQYRGYYVGKGRRRRPVVTSSRIVRATNERDVNYSGYVIGEALQAARRNKDEELEATALIWRGKPQDIRKATGIVSKFARDAIRNNGNIYEGVVAADSLVVSFGLNRDQIPIIGQTIQEQMQAAGTRRDYNRALKWARLGGLDGMIATYDALSKILPNQSPTTAK